MEFKVYLIGDKTKDYFRFNQKHLEKLEVVGVFKPKKYNKTFIRGHFEFSSNSKSKSWYNKYIKGVRQFFYIEGQPIFDSFRFNDVESTLELYYANLEKLGADKPFKIFVAMPFDTVLEDTFDTILAVGENLRTTMPDIEIYRLDMHEGESVNLPDEIYQNIIESGIIIAELTGGNANVYYELGISDALQKKVIQICKNSKDLKFDVAHKKTIIYPTLKVLKEKLERNIRAIYNR